MKKRKWAAFAAVFVMLLTACGRADKNSVVTEEIIVPELSSEDLLVTSLEYLLKDEEESDLAAQEQTETAENAGQAEAAQKVPVVLYYSNGSFDGLESQTEEVEELSADALITALAKHNIVSLDTKVLSFEAGEKEEGTVLYLELSAEMNNYLRNMSEEAKNLIIDSLTSTFLENYDAEAVHIRVAGEPLEHAETADGI